MSHILLVDDDMNFRRSLVIQLELEGHIVTDLETGDQALTLLDRFRDNKNMPHILISDVRMPQMDGEEFVERIQKRFPQLPVLVISAFDPPGLLSQYPFLRKPFKLHEMVNAINAVVKGE